MGLGGDLADISPAEIVQFIHLGGRSGTLRLADGERRGAISFHRGRIIGASGPGTKRLGELLVEAGAVAASTLAEALARQETTQPRPSLGQALLQLGAIEPDAMYRAVEKQIEHTVYELVTWTRGSFEFALDVVEPIDDLAMAPGDIIPHINLNTQLVLMEALRIFDERNRTNAGVPSPLPQEESAASQPIAAEAPGEASALPLPAAAPKPEESTRPFRLQILSTDEPLMRLVAGALARYRVRVTKVAARDAGAAPLGEAPPVVLVDLREGGGSIEIIRSIRRARPRALVLAVPTPSTDTMRVFGAGALGILPPHPPTIAACFLSLCLNLTDQSRERAIERGVKERFARLHRVFQDLRSGLVSATLALNLMNVIAETVERAVLFLVRRDDLRVLGAFGPGADGTPLSASTQELSIPVGGGSALEAAIGDGKTRTVPFEEAGLPPALAETLGRPQNGEVVIFPVLGGQRVFAVIYTDNGKSRRRIAQVETLELATAQVGMAFENEILRRHLASKSPEEPEAGEGSNSAG